VLLVNLLAGLNFANVFLNKKRLEDKKTLKRKNVTKIKKREKTLFSSMILGVQPRTHAKSRVGMGMRGDWMSDLML